MVINWDKHGVGHFDKLFHASYAASCLKVGWSMLKIFS